MTKAMPLITPTFRAAWADMLANDPRLSPTAVRAGIILGGHFNNFTAETYANQKTLARKAKISSRTAWTCLQRLVHCGHLTKRRGGRRSDVYGMPVESVATYCNIYFEKSRTPLRILPEETSQDSSESLATAEGKPLMTQCDEEVT